MTKEELMQCRSKQKELIQIDDRIDKLRADARSTKAICCSDEPKHRGEPIPAVQTYIERLEELSALYEAKKAELQTSIIRVERAIFTLPSELRMLMRARYILGMKWEVINEKMCISESTSKRMHRKALQLLKDGLV